MKFARPRNSKGIGSRLELGEFVASVRIAVDRGSDRILLRDQLHHDPFEQRAICGFDDAMRAAQELRHALRLCGLREQEESSQQCGRRKHPATTPDASDHGFLRVSASDSAD
jgi:hypothetical protein